MVAIGYALSSEEHEPRGLLRNACLAEDAGFEFALISDHYHPWLDRQGNSPFVWEILGALSQVSDRIRIGTGVTCPTMRIHPAIIAQAAATASVMMPGRFFLGVGSGENLNEHVTGARWPSPDLRLEMLEEAIEVMRLLWQGGMQTYRGVHYQVEKARLYTLPEEPPPVVVAASGPVAASLAGRCGDGIISLTPDSELLSAFDEAGGAGKPRIAMTTVCWAETEAEARRTAFEWWPQTALEGDLAQELPLPEHFEQASSVLSEDQVARAIKCGPDPQMHKDAIQMYVDAGFDHVYVHQVGPDQQGFIDFYAREVLPHFRTEGREALAQAR